MKIRVIDPSQVSEARRVAASVAAGCHFNDTDVGRLAIITTEAATNLVKHAKDGEILVTELRDGARRGVEILAVDSGPGMGNTAEAMQDGHSKAGTAGNGLGAIARMADQFDLYSLPGKGTVLLARVWMKKQAPELELETGAVNEPVAGEHVCGDAWAVRSGPGKALFVIADGLGHGAGAAAASEAAIRVFRESESESPGRLLEEIHQALRSTRGAAVSVASVDIAGSQVVYAGIGNISGHIINPQGNRPVVSHNGTAGHEVRRIQEFSYPWRPESILLLHSDGIATHWSLESYPGLLMRHPSLIAATLYRDQQRRRDDVTVVAARQPGSGSS